MIKLSTMVLASLTTFAMVGCGNSYDDNKQENEVSNQKSLKISTRTAKYLVDTDGMTLYIFDKDSFNKSNCNAECQKIWPLFNGADTTNENIKVLEGTDHLAYRQHPLYYFAKDKIAGDILGNHIKDVWHIIFAPKGSTDTQTALSDTNILQAYLTDKNGMSLYTFDRDSENISKCTGKADTKPLGSCEARWPVFYVADLGTLPTGLKASDFGTIDRPSDTLKDANGDPLATKQTTYKGHPLYYWFKDEKAGDVKGDWVGGVWDLVELSSGKVKNQSGDVNLGKAIFENPNKCSSCHGANGKETVGGGNNINLAGNTVYRNASTVEERLKDMKNANSRGRVARMVRVAKGLSDTQIKNLSAYIATLGK